MVKDNAASVLDMEFSREKWRNVLTVNLATVTDPYQPAESKFNITRQVLEIFLKHHNSLMLTTKSDLILRDVDILTKIAETGFLNAVITLPTLNDELRKKIEPNVPSVERRLEIIRQLHEAGITVGVTAIPLLPYISDDEKDLEELIRTLTEAKADYVIVDMLNFRGESRDRFTGFLKNYDSDLIPKYEKLYQTNYCEKNYTKKIKNQANKFIKKYKVDQYDKMFSFTKEEKKIVSS